MIAFAELLSALAAHKVEFIVIGGVAGALHGSARLTQDLDVVYRRTRDNMQRLAASLADALPYLRGAPAGLPFIWGVETLSRGLNFTLQTGKGPIDLLADVTGGGGYDDLLPFTEEMELNGIKIRVVSLPALIRLKRAAGRPRDIEAISELEALREESGI